MNYRATLEGKMATRIVRKKQAVLVREDFTDLGDYDQVGRALRVLVRKGKLIRIGYGLYAKTKVSSITGKILPAEPLPSLAQQALQRLGITTVLTKAEKDYIEGRSTQVPTGRTIGVVARISRKIAYKETAIYYERSTD